MTRNALRRYLYSLVVASLPGCCDGTPRQTRGVDVDAAIFVDGGMYPGYPTVPPDVCNNICKLDLGCSGNQDTSTGRSRVFCTISEGTAGSCHFPLAAGGRPPAGLRPVAIFCDDP